MSTTSRINVKITHHSDVRRIVLEERKNAWNVLVKQIRLVFNLTQVSTFKVQYVDEEGDSITISSDRELSEAIDQFQGKPSVRLNLVIDSTPITPSPSIQEKSAPIARTEPIHKSIQEQLVDKPSNTDPSSSSSDSDSSTTSDSSSDTSSESDSEERIERSGRNEGRYPRHSKEHNGKFAKHHGGHGRKHWKKHRDGHGKKAAQHHGGHGKKHWKKHRDGHGKKHWKKHRDGSGKRFDKPHEGQVENFMEKRQQKRGSFGRDLAALDAKGYSEKRVNIMLLRRFADDETRVEKVIALLVKNTQLETKGYTKQGMNLRLLLRFDGDLDKVLEKLDHKKAKWEKHQQWNEALKQLEAMGYYKRGLNRMLLCKNDGDISAVEAVLSKSTVLEERGFCKTRLNIRLLEKFDGNVDDVEEFLITKDKKTLKHCKRGRKHINHPRHRK